jgi:hypothetical protein
MLHTNMLGVYSDFCKLATADLVVGVELKK